MGEDYRFTCPGCGRPYKANKDLSGRLKRCGKCRGTFTIRREAPKKRGGPAPLPEPVILHDPELPIDQVFAALQDWQKSARSLPGSFAREITFGSFDPAYRVTLQATIESDGRRSSLSARKETLTLPAEAAAGAARKVVDLRFEHTSELAKLLADKPAAVRAAAEQLAKELRPPAGGHFAGRHLVIEHLQAWQAHWVFHHDEGNAWFFGKPLQVFLPNPPKRSAVPAVLGTLLGLAAAGVLGWVLWEFDLVQPGSRNAAAPPPVVKAAAPAKAGPLRFAKDGVLQLEDGSFLRGSLERRDEAVVVQGAGAAQSVEPWQIESLHVDAPVFLRGEARRLDELEGRVKAAREAKQAPARESLVGLFLEVYRQRERWARLEALCSAAELPGDPGPQKRIEVLRAGLEKLLEAAAPATAVSAAPAGPAEAVKAPEPAPAVAMAAGLLRQLLTATDAPARASLLSGLQALKGEKLPQSDLIGFAGLYLARSGQDAGLISDSLHVQTPQLSSTYEGVFEKQNDGFVKMKTYSGQEITAYQEKGGWTVRLPGGVLLDGARCTANAGAATASALRIRASLDRLPPERWMNASAADHLKEARTLVEVKSEVLKDRGLLLLRALAAGHASAALKLGAPAEILEARKVLFGLGFAQTPEGRWERPEDRRAAQMGSLLREGKGDEARALLPGPRGSQDFLGAYRSALVQFQSTMKSVEDLNRATAALDQSIGQAATAGESKHLLALRAAVSGFGICGSCGGNPAKVCSVCRGKGTRTEACLPCGGIGYKVTVGIGATGRKTCEVCQGKPIRGTRPCEKCEGKGTRSCPKCQGVTRLPVATDVGRTRPCERCAGSGGHGENLIHACASCVGLGVQWVPAGAPDATLP